MVRAQLRRQLLKRAFAEWGMWLNVSRLLAIPAGKYFILLANFSRCAGLDAARVRPYRAFLAYFSYVACQPPFARYRHSLSARGNAAGMTHNRWPGPKAGAGGIKENRNWEKRMANDPRTFANEWVAAWNAHDLDRILSHYSPDIVFLSPIAAARTGNGRVVGKEALRSYWAGALAAFPDLRFEIADVLAGHECLTILYRNQRGMLVAETFEFGEKGDVVRSFACYAGP
jgi:hypothetical protein